MTESGIPENLEPRFAQPKGWRWHHFERVKGRKIRFGSVFPEDSIPDAVVVCLQGVREFSEKYFEIAHWCLENNLAFWTMDWVGQGKSSRYLKNPQKRYSNNFENDIDDLHFFIKEYIIHSCVHPDRGRIPMAMLAHSMGANIGMRFLEKHNETFECAAFTAPLVGIKAFKSIPNHVMLGVGAFCNIVVGKSYVPGGKDWEKRTDRVRLTSDEPRNNIDERWCKADADLRCGDLTFRWVYEAHKSCMALQKTAEYIPTPCLLGIAGEDDLVDNTKTEKIAGKMSDVNIIEYPGSYHEILMEKDSIRGNFLMHFHDIIKERIIDRPETLKPF